MFLAAGACAAGWPEALNAAEMVTFTSGFQITVRGHRLEDAQYVLLEAGGAIQVPLQLVASIEPLPDAGIPACPSVVTTAAAPDAPGIPEVRSLLAAAAADAGLPETLVLSVAKVESDFVATARSPKGAVGLMQLMPATATALGVAAGDVQANAAGGARYLRQLLIRYHGEARLALAAYNAGPAAVDRFHDIPPIPETQRYVDLVLREYYRREAAQAATRSSITSNAR